MKFLPDGINVPENWGILVGTKLIVDSCTERSTFAIHLPLEMALTDADDRRGL